LIPIVQSKSRYTSWNPTIQEINDILKGEIIETSQSITAPEQLEAASESEISFIGNKKYEKFWADSKLV
jgi:UDP-3-O-[3-hydroxymyristoyl] glucosamine N-acyltransferase